MAFNLRNRCFLKELDFTPHAHGVRGRRPRPGRPWHLSGAERAQIGHKESMKDTARVLGRTFDGIEYRGFGQETVETLAKYSGVPV